MSYKDEIEFAKEYGEFAREVSRFWETELLHDAVMTEWWLHAKDPEAVIETLCGKLSHPELSDDQLHELLGQIVLTLKYRSDNHEESNNNS